jgi:hypothetical protein
MAGIHLLKDDRELARKALNDAFRVKSDLVSAQVIPLLGQTLGGSLLKLR